MVRKGQILMVAAAIAVMSFSLAPPTGAEEPLEKDYIQPGSAVFNFPLDPPAYTVEDRLHCTLNYIFDSNVDKKVYVGTAGHCFKHPGESNGYAYKENATNIGEHFGVIRHRVDQEAPSQIDFMLIEVRSDWLGEVRTNVALHPGAPSGVAVPGNVSNGAQVGIVRWAGVVSGNPVHNNRTGILTHHQAEHYCVDGASSGGDSGGPVFHRETGLAIGIVRGPGVPIWGSPCYPAANPEGMTVQAILAYLAGEDFDVSLRVV